MNKVVTQIREISKIEEELASSFAGVFAFHSNEEKIIQVSCTFLYYHKNIYAVINENEDFFTNIIYDTNVSFTIVKSEKPKNSKQMEFKPLYRIFSASLSGILKKPEEIKVSDIIKELYYLKYTGNKAINEKEEAIRFLMLDTVEIMAFEEVGG